MHILIVANHSLLGDMLENLLSNIPTSYIRRITSANADILLPAIDQHQPEVIVLDEELIGKNPLCLLRQLLDHSQARVIFTNYQENRVHVYDKFTAPLSQAADLIALTVTGNSHSSLPVPKKPPEKAKKN